MLEKIDLKDVVVTNGLEDDRICTELTLLDYDWMNYYLTTRFTTEKLGVLAVTFEYFGTTTSTMIVKQFELNSDKSAIYCYEYPTEIFTKYITQYMQKHIASWDDKYAFSGEDIVIDFYNEVLEKHINQTDGKEAYISDIAEKNNENGRAKRDYYRKFHPTFIYAYA